VKCTLFPLRSQECTISGVNFVSVLHAQRAFLNARDASGRTVLVLAASRGSWDAVSELLTCNADSQICSNDGQNFLHYVVALGGDPEVFRDEIRQVISSE
jgi:ankyrin repeat protein